MNCQRLLTSKGNLIYLFVTLLFLSHPTKSFSQTTTINYLTSSLSTSACNVFQSSPSVGGQVHTSLAGGVTFSTSTGIFLATTPASSNGPAAGTAYVIDYTFTPQDQYSVAITTSGGDGSSTLYESAVSSLANFPTSSGDACTPDADVSGYNTQGFGAGSFGGIGSGSKTNTISFTASSAAEYLVIWANGASLDLDGFSISEIVITKTVPSCTLPGPTGLGTANNGTTLTWGAVSGAASYKIAVNDNGTIHNLTSTTNSVGYCASANGDNVSFTVQSVCSGGLAGGTSSPHAFTYNNVLATATGLAFSPVYPFIVYWNAVSGATGYWYEASSGSPISVSGTSVSDPDAELSYGNTYSVKVEAYNACATGSYCTPIQAVMPPANPPCSTAPTVATVEGGTYVVLYAVSGAASYNVGFVNSAGILVYQVDNIGSVITTSGYNCTGVPAGSYYIIAQTNCTGEGSSNWGSRYFGGLQTVSSIIRPLDSTAFRSALISNPADGTISMTVYPNPSRSQANIIYNTSVTGPADISVTTEFGNTVIHQAVSTVAGQNNYALDIGQLASGVYIVRLTDGKNIRYQKLVVAK
jgi:hypothetical protein